MLGCKVIVTYKRKRLTGNGQARGNGYQSSVSVSKETPLRNSDLSDDLINKQPLEVETINSLHVVRERSLCCSCVDERDCSSSPSTQKQSRVAAEKNMEESSEGTSIVGRSFIDDSLQNKSSSSAKADILGERREVSDSRDSATATTSCYVGLKPSFESKSSFESHDTLSVPKTSSKKISDSLSKDEHTVLCADLAETTKLRAPLITFVRRRKRKRNLEGDDQTANKRSTASSCEMASEKGCFAGDGTDLMPPTEAYKTSDTIFHNENETLEVDSQCARATSVHDAKILILDGEPIGGQNVSKNVLHEDEVLDLNDQIAVDDQETSCQGISLSNDNTGKSSGKNHTCEREESQAILNDGLKSTVEGSRTVLDLSVTPTDSNGTLEGKSNSQKQSVHAVAETILGSMDSTSRSHFTASHRAFPQVISNIRSEGLWESTSTHHLHLGKEADANRNDSNKAPPIALDLMPKNKCLQLFSEEKTEDNFFSTFMQHEVTTCMTPEERSFQFEVENNPPKSSPPILGLSLLTRPKTSRFGSNKCFTTFPFLSSIGQTTPQPSPSRFAAFLRHDSTPDGIVSHTRASGEKDIFQEHNHRPYTSTWTEEELDSLWIGVRRYGRHNWNAMIRDPRFRFSSWRVARDLAEQWEEEQSKLLHGRSASQFQHSNAQGISLGVNGYSAITGIWRESNAEETRLSLGDVYASSRGRNMLRRARFKSANLPRGFNSAVKDPFLGFQGNPFNRFRDKTMLKNHPSSASGPTKGNLPHWLREAIFSPPLSRRELPEAMAATSGVNSEMTNVALPHHELHLGRMNETGLMGKDVRTSGEGGRRVSGLSAMNHRFDDVIVIDSDVSSEETISDDRCARL